MPRAMVEMLSMENPPKTDPPPDAAARRKSTSPRKKSSRSPARAATTPPAGTSGEGQVTFGDEQQITFKSGDEVQKVRKDIRDGYKYLRQAAKEKGRRSTRSPTPHPRALGEEQTMAIADNAESPQSKASRRHKQREGRKAKREFSKLAMKAERAAAERGGDLMAKRQLPLHLKGKGGKGKEKEKGGKGKGKKKKGKKGKGKKKGRDKGKGQKSKRKVTLDT
jgi:hypothetical protein